MQIRNLHICKFRFLFPVSFTTEYKVGISELYLHTGFRADLLKMWSPQRENCQNRNPHTSKIRKLLPVCFTNNRRRSGHISEPHAKFRENR